MIPRGKIDIGWSDLLYGLGCCGWPGDRKRVQRKVEAFWSDRAGALACLSVRSGFDLLLQSYALPPGSEVLVSAITIRDMTRILEEHQLVPVPVDLDMKRLEVKPHCLERGLTPKTRALLVAHIFGSRMDLDPVAGFARQHQLLLIEDCAQAYLGNDYRGHPDSDVAMFSFGPTKTNTALGGAVLRIQTPLSWKACARCKRATRSRLGPHSLNVCVSTWSSKRSPIALRTPGLRNYSRQSEGPTTK